MGILSYSISASNNGNGTADLSWSVTYNAGANGGFTFSGPGTSLAPVGSDTYVHQDGDGASGVHTTTYIGAGTFTWYLNTAHYGNKSATATITDAPPPPPTYPPSWSDNTLSVAQASVAYSDGVSATNMNYSGSYSVSSGSLPAGLSLNTSTGAVTGTPTVSGTFNFSITASNSYGSISQAFTFVITGVPSTGNMQVYNGTDWVSAPVYVRNGSTWVLAPVYVYNGSSWVMAI